jgi:Flp pilus assembly protein TadD
MSHINDPAPSAHETVLRNRRQAEFEMDFFGRILQRHPCYVDVLKRQAELLTGYGRRQEALAYNQQLAAVLPKDPNVKYHLACALARLGQRDDAFQALSQALELGFRDFECLEFDPDLDSLREHPKYQALVRGQGMGI